MVDSETEMLEEISTLKAKVTALEAEVLHWKANHASVTRKSHILIERIDMPIERVKAFELIGQLQDSVSTRESDYKKLKASTDNTIEWYQARHALSSKETP